MQWLYLSGGTSFGLLLNGVIVPPLLALGGWRLVWAAVVVSVVANCPVGYRQDVAARGEAIVASLAR